MVNQLQEEEKENIDFDEHELEDNPDKYIKNEVEELHEEQENSMKMEDLLKTFENENNPNPPAKLNLKNLGTIKQSTKQIHMTNNDQDNSNYGTEWMSEKGK